MKFSGNQGIIHGRSPSPEILLVSSDSPLPLSPAQPLFRGDDTMEIMIYDNSKSQGSGFHRLFRR